MDKHIFKTICKTIRKKENRPDMILYLLVSQMCNIRCNFCYQKSFGMEQLSDEVLYEKLKPIYPRVKFLPIVGGEVTIVPGMKEYVKWIKDNYPQIDILIGTNGVEFDDEWIELTEKYDLMINYSLNAVKQSTYNKILRKGNSQLVFKKINDNFNKLLEVQKKKKKNIINEVSMVVTEYTACDVEAFIIKALENGLNPMIRFNVENDSEITDNILEAEKTTIKLKFFCEDYITVTPWHNPNHLSETTIIADMRTNLAGEKKDFLETHKKIKAAAETVTYIDYLNKSEQCSVINQALAIEFDGTVVPCYNLPNYVIGNIYYNDIDEIMNSKELVDIRAQIKCGEYKYCFERCPLNKNPKSTIKNAEVKYNPLYRKLFIDGQYNDALHEYEKIENTSLFKVREKYEMAYCLHITKKDLNKAIKLYSAALSDGFDEFWIRYNRCSAYIELNDMQNARQDLETAYEINPEHDGVTLLMKGLGDKND